MSTTKEERDELGRRLVLRTDLDGWARDVFRRLLDERDELANVRVNQEGIITRERARAEKAEAEVERLTRALALDTPWPVHDVLRRLACAARHLLHHHSCDAHGYEGVSLAAAAAERIANALAPPKPEGTEASPPERIVAAAVRYQAQGKHHAECFRKLATATLERVQEQGFLTSTGRFVDRYEALGIAAAAGQLEGRTRHNPQDRLMSEDLDLSKETNP